MGGFSLGEKLLYDKHCWPIFKKNLWTNYCLSLNLTVLLSVVTIPKIWDLGNFNLCQLWGKPTYMTEAQALDMLRTHLCGKGEEIPPICNRWKEPASKVSCKGSAGIQLSRLVLSCRAGAFFPGPASQPGSRPSLTWDQDQTTDLGPVRTGQATRHHLACF